MGFLLPCALVVQAESQYGNQQFYPYHHHRRTQIRTQDEQPLASLQKPLPIPVLGQSAKSLYNKIVNGIQSKPGKPSKQYKPQPQPQPTQLAAELFEPKTHPRPYQPQAPTQPIQQAQSYQPQPSSQPQQPAQSASGGNERENKSDSSAEAVLQRMIKKHQLFLEKSRIASIAHQQKQLQLLQQSVDIIAAQVDKQKELENIEVQKQKEHIKRQLASHDKNRQNTENSI